MSDINFKIDFVVTWVDGQEPKWLSEYSKYRQEDSLDVKTARFRDYGIFKYWFRAVQEYAPWVNHVYLVTDGQKPEWINDNCNWITIVDHKEIIPEKYRPIFNSSAIELNLYKIPNLSEHFVYFNDDMFLNKKVIPEDFFSKKGLPKDTAGLNAIQPMYDFDYIHVNNVKVINEQFKKREVMRKQFFKFLNMKNMELNIYTILLFFWPKFTRFFDLHYPYSILKSEMSNVIHENPKEYVKTMSDRFRWKDDITIWLVRYYSLVTGKFSPRTPRVGKIYDLFDQFEDATKDIENGNHKMIVINDDSNITDKQFETIAQELKRIYQRKLPNESVFEKERKY
ncbi:stealth family protein [Companilactobacillus kimchiensis]|uniref:Glycosyltransferase n=1 Tax=Companilactobacillus kimchiensis TaxID=993692 RepID=A0A0R2LFP3_9LACO|nr:stealth family protein [Companilactobacillus kimchiensis]KRO00385.1 glycosyltransferase [Companilactobacillus kimchiensis]